MPHSSQLYDHRDKQARPVSFVLAHGSWHGGWCWAPVARQLRQAGYEVHCPSFTGMGDRAHLLSPDVNLETFIEDLVRVIETEELPPVVLVGHSFGGIPISGVADRIPDRLAHLVYLDALVLEDGQHAFSGFPSDEARARTQQAAQAEGGLAVPPPGHLPAAWGIDKGTPLYDWVLRRLTPHPLGAYQQAVTLKHPLGNGVPCTYVHARAPSHAILDSSRQRARAQTAWQWREVDAPHELHLTHPDLVAGMLRELAGESLEDTLRYAEA